MTREAAQLDKARQENSRHADRSQFVREAALSEFSAAAWGTVLDLLALESAPLQHVPFHHSIVRDFINASHLDAILDGFPAVPGPGSHAPASLDMSAPFAAFLRELQGDGFRHAIERKFEIDLGSRPTVTTIRGEVRASDGRVHTDSRSKLITILIYLNGDWSAPGGRLRLLRSQNLDDYAIEIAPEAGTLLAFRRSEHSWHGHAPFAGSRRAVQMSYVTNRATAVREERRHRLATGLKRIAHDLVAVRTA
jgi:SM-20-related protein